MQAAGLDDEPQGMGKGGRFGPLLDRRHARQPVLAPLVIHQASVGREREGGAHFGAPHAENERSGRFPVHLACEPRGGLTLPRSTPPVSLFAIPPGEGGRERGGKW